MGVKPGQITKFLYVVDVHAELRDVIPLDPGQRIRKLHAAFVDGIENAEVVPEEKSIWNVEVGFSGGAGEIVMTARPLNENAVDQIRPERRSPGADQRLVAQENIVTAAGSADAAAVQRAADQLIQIASVFNRVAHGQAIAGIELVIDFDDSVVIVFRLQDIQIFRRDSQRRFGLVDQRQVRGRRAVQQRDRFEQRGRICGSFAAALAFVVGEEEGLVLLDGTANGGAELILAQGLGLRRDLQERTGVRGAVLQVIVNRTVQIVGAGLGDDIDDAAERAAVFGAETVVDHAEFADGFLRRSRTLRACRCVDVVGAVHGDFIAEVAHACRRKRE